MKKQLLSKVLFSMFFVLIGIQVLAQDRTVSGRVTASDDGSGIPGASVSVKGTSKGATSDADGNYKITVSGSAVITVSSVGFISQDITVGNRTQINVVLVADTKSLQEVVVVGYGTQKKSQMTGAISSVGSKEIQELPITNARQALQGRAAGVDVVQPGSKPGAGPQIRIRGRRSFNASNDPLYVVDGIPLSSGIDDINPNDIVSMEVLKDASATAIYGARGANGVVIITTKRGKAGATVVSVDSYYGLNQELGTIGVMNGAQFAEYKRESRRAVGQYPLGAATAADDAKIFEPRELTSIQNGRSTDYVAGMLRAGAIQSHQVAVSGGSEKTTFNISANFFQDIGVVKSQDFSRTTFRVNLDHKINDKIKIGLSTLIVNSVRNGENLNLLAGAMQENPLGEPYDAQGNLVFLPTNDGLRTNPFSELVTGVNVDENKRYRTFNSLFGEWDIAKGLKYRVNFGPDLTVGRAGRFIGAFTNNNRGGNATGSINEQFLFNWTLENIVTYNKKFKDVHNLNLTGLQSIQRDRDERTTISVNGIPAESAAYHRLGDANQITGANTDLIEWTLLSYMGRVNYDYKEKYLFTATVRMDGSSRFGANTKFGLFPSFALGWNISEEPFIKNISAIDQLKLRASWGAIGNQAITPYQTQALLGRTAYAWDNTAAFGYRPNSIGNPDLRWETSTTTNAGLDFSFFRGRLSGSAEYYQTNTTDLLAPQPLPTSIGFGGFTTNVGETQNTGIELTLNTVNIDRGGFQWTSDFIFNRNREQIVSLANGKVDDIGAGRFIGQPLSVFFDLKKVGIWQANEADAARAMGERVGQIKVEDFNGDGKINADDRQILGSAVPAFTAGLTNRFSYKGFDLSFFVFARVGQLIRSRFHDNVNQLAGRYNNLNLNYWTPNNPTNEFPQPVVTQEFPKYGSSLTYFEGSFFKIRNINIGYNLPDNVAKKLKMQSVRVFASIQQPLILAEYRQKYKGIDPETFVDGEQGVGGGEVNTNVSPATSVTTFGLNLKF
ncbi:SusC/RagA family TonB-linked outer membrane protein [Aquirufa sp.]|jgi:TonB-linked SusC/RagA family outer membrane protein|uniref:SusC/RagA family TonB-linked outer membrane protein n=1 Tax=Aquirufa sp. TaxID=2676249 RepID=UPI0037C118B0